MLAMNSIGHTIANRVDRRKHEDVLRVWGQYAAIELFPIRLAESVNLNVSQLSGRRFAYKLSESKLEAR